MRATEAEHQGGKDRGHETAVHQEVGCAKDESVEEDSDEYQADERECQALTWGDGEGVLKFSEGDTNKEGADVWEGCVLEESDELCGTVTVNWADDVIGVEQEVERVGYQADDPERE